MFLNTLLISFLISMMPLQQLPFDYECSDEAISGLAPQAVAAFCAVAEEYTSETGQRLTVTSGKRSLRHCASLMAAMSVEQLEGMYCRNGYPDYIRVMKDAMTKNGRNLTTDEAYEILRNRSEGFISSHLFGAAIDVATEGLKDAKRLEELLSAHGFTVLNENSLGVKCLHASYKNVVKQIIKE